MLRLLLLVLSCLLAQALPKAQAQAQSASGYSVSLSWVGADGVVVETMTLAVKDLESERSRNITTSTPWTTGIKRFSGPLLRDLAALRRFPVTTIEVNALNDYSAVIQNSDAEKYDFVLATRIDGELIRVRDKGPLWLILPLDEKPALNSQYYYSQMVWQVREIRFRNY